MEITKDLLHELFEYKDGVLYWKNSRANNKIKKGDVAGNVKNNGYLYISINNKLYRGHRLIFLMHYGYFPKYIDHIDNNRLNNRIENLRPATASENQHNSKISSHNTSGVKGVSWCIREKKWRAGVMCGGITKYSGRFSSLEKAIEVIKNVRKQLHGEFARDE